jgi:hypothetical protein
MPPERLKAMLPAFKVRWRGALRRSCTTASFMASSGHNGVSAALLHCARRLRVKPFDPRRYPSARDLPVGKIKPFMGGVAVILC